MFDDLNRHLWGVPAIKDYFVYVISLSQKNIPNKIELGVNHE